VPAGALETGTEFVLDRFRFSDFTSVFNSAMRALRSLRVSMNLGRPFSGFTINMEEIGRDRIASIARLVILHYSNHWACGVMAARLLVKVQARVRIPSGPFIRVSA
jgi:hypothetical protein